MSRKYWLIGALVSFVALGVGGAYAAREPVAYATIATGYAAKETCSCLFVSGRTMDSCLSEFPEDVRGKFNVTASGHQVRASVLFGVIHADARYDEGFGCRAVN